MNQKRILLKEKRNGTLLFTCHERECKYRVKYVMKNGLYENEINQEHSPYCCSCNPKPLKDHLRNVVHQYYYHGLKCSKGFVAKISLIIGCNVPYDRVHDHLIAIGRCTPMDRIDSWTKLVQLATKIEEEGGEKSLIYDGMSVKFCSVLPHYAINFIHSRAFFPLVIGDGTHSNSISKGVYIIFLTITGNHEILPLAYGYGPTESLDNINNVLKLLSPHFTTIDRKISFINDKGTAFVSAINDLSFSKEAFHCCWHLLNKLPAEIKKLFYEAQQTEDFISFYNVLRIIQLSHPTIYNKLKPDFKSLFKFYAPGARYGYTTSQASESLNSIIRTMRSEEPVNVFEFLYYFGMKTLSYHRSLFMKGTLTPFLERAIKHSQLKADKLDVKSIVNNYSFRVINDVKHNEFIVVIDSANSSFSCSCKKYEDRGNPCSHIFACLRNVSSKIRYYDLVDDSYKTCSYHDNFDFKASPLDYNTIGRIPALPPLISDRRKGKQSRFKSLIEQLREKYS